MTNLSKTAAQIDAILGGTFVATSPSEATLGENILLNGDFATNDLTSWSAAAGWSASTGKALHTTGTTPLTQSVDLTIGDIVEVAVTTTDRTIGECKLTFGSLIGIYEVAGLFTHKKTFTATATASYLLTFTPTTDFNGAIDNITVKKVTLNATPIIVLKDSTEVEIIPFRGSDSLRNIGVGLGALSANLSEGTDNTVIGYKAMENNTTANGGVAVGTYALRYNTTGLCNVAIGVYAMEKNIYGDFNAAFGTWALQANVSGSYNTAIGLDALNGNLAGNSNTAVGFQSLFRNNGSNNCTLGKDALYENTTGADNIGIGYRSLKNNTDGLKNIAIGSNALSNNSHGSYNVAVGPNTLLANTTGISNVAIGNYALSACTNKNDNTAVGNGSGINCLGDFNTAIGSESMYGYGAMAKNCAFGFAAARSITTGVGNINFGYGAGYGATTTNAPATDDYGILIGYNANRSVVTATKLTNYLALGNAALVDKSNQFVYGNASVTEHLFRSGYIMAPSTPTYADNAAAVTGGLVAGTQYKTVTGELRIVV